MNDTTADAAVHDEPIAQRLIEQGIRDWLNTATAIAHAANGSPPINDYERGVRQGIDRMRHLHLDNYWYTLVPRLMDELKRAGALKP